MERRNDALLKATGLAFSIFSKAHITVVLASVRREQAKQELQSLITSPLNSNLSRLWLVTASENMHVGGMDCQRVCVVRQAQSESH